MKTKSEDSNALPKLKKKFLPLVENCQQIAIDNYFFGHEAYHSQSSGEYAVNKDGELIHLGYTGKRNIDWTLLTLCNNLQSLSLTHCELELVPDELLNLLSLKKINLSNNNLTQLPENFEKLHNLEALSLRDNNFVKLPDSIGKLKKLQQLSIENNKLTELPESITQLNNLTGLSLAMNQFTIYPEQINKLTELDELHLSHNLLTKLPDTISTLKKLTFLTLNSNKITKLPEGVCKLKHLRLLILENNQVSDIPDSIGQLGNLTYFDLKNNQLTKIPVSLEKLNLNNLNLEDNPLPIPDLSFHELNAQEKIQTLLSIQSSELYPLKQAKILIVGDGRVGKTSIINRLLGNSHDDNQASTQGIDISTLNFDDFHANIWDFAGQELAHQTHQFFLTERSLYIYVLDAQNEDNQARDLHWFNTIKSYSENSPIIVVVNHSDQNLNYQFDTQRYQDNFQIVDVIHTSACNLNSLSEKVKYKLGNSIDKLNLSIKRQLPKLPGIERKLPQSWHQVKEAMEGFKLTHNVIEKDIYEKECEKAGVIGKPLQTALLKILNSIGTVIAYPNDFRLKLTQILKPEWVTNAVYQIVRSPPTTPGIYSEETIGDILDGGYTLKQQQWLIDLLIKFELGFRLSDTAELLIPMRLPSVMPEYDKTRYQKGLNIRFNYHRHGLLKLNVLPQLIVRMNLYVNEQTTKYWRHGLFLIHNDCQGVIVADDPNQCIEVFLSTRNENARTLLQWIRANLVKIEESQIKASKDNSLPYKEEIAIFDDTYSNVLGYVSYQRIERMHQKEKEYINVEITSPETGDIDDHDVNIANLLGLYKGSKKALDSNELVNSLTKILLRLTELKAKIIDEKEDDINDRLRESLISGGYSITDQSRGGFSGSGNGVGERDLIILDEYGQQAILIEAMCLGSAVKKTITSHYEKLTNHYNTQGNPFDFLITYAKVKNFEGFWKSYRNNFNSIDDVTSRFTEKSVIKIGTSEVPIEGSDQSRRIIHLIVNFGVKP